MRDLAFDAEFDAAICLCQGGFGLLGGADDEAVIGRIAARRPARAVGSRSARSPSYFALRWIEDGDDFDPATGVNHEVATLRNEAGEEISADLWTTCFTARELSLLARGGRARGRRRCSGVTPGDYGIRPVVARPSRAPASRTGARGPLA